MNKVGLDLSVGSKVFVVGEYLALNGGPAVVAITNPRFRISVSLRSIRSENSESVETVGIHPLSPAGLFIDLHKDFFKNYSIGFHDPYKGAGGFGASTAQFALVAGLFESRQAIENNAQPLFDYQKILKSYRDLAWNKMGFPPSGSDLLAQFKGGLCIVDSNLGRVEKLVWNFQKLTLGFIRTGNKIETHEHLKQLKPFDNTKLLDFVSSFIENIRNQNEEQTIYGFNAIGAELDRLGFQCEKTKLLISNLKTSKLVLVAKG
jgi:mevalonate kinase